MVKSYNIPVNHAIARGNPGVTGAGPIPSLPREGETVGSGVVQSLIANGGMAAVFKTWVEGLELYRAVKVMRPDASDQIRERMNTEARISGKLVHNNIIRVYNVGETAAGLPYLEMDYVDGPTLQALIRRHGALPLPVAFAVAAGTLEGLRYAHTLTYTLYGAQRTGVMHRDIKPANVIISSESGAARLMDFGIARPVDVSIHTVAETVPGTIVYMAPEAYSGGKCDARSDIYQFGLLLYECLSGRLAFPQTDLASLFTAKNSNAYPQLKTDPRAAAIVEKCMRLTPEKRYQSAEECLADVRALYAALCPDTAAEPLVLSFLGGKLPKALSNRGYGKPLAATKIMDNPLFGDTLLATGVKRHSGKPLAATEVTDSPLLDDTLTAIVWLKRLRAKRLKLALTAAAYALAALTVILAAVSYGPRLLRPATPTPPGGVVAENAPPPSAKTASVPAAPSADISVKKTASAAQAAPVKKAAPANAAVSDSALLLIRQADALFSEKKFNEALDKYLNALRMPSSAPRQEVVRKSVYGSARCNTALFQAGRTPRQNYEAAWRSVISAFPPGSQERLEAQKHFEGADK